MKLSAHEQRKWERFSAHLDDKEEVAVLLGPSRMQVAKLVDESRDGIGVLLPAKTVVRMGQKVEVTYRRTTVRAIVKSVTSLGDRGVRVGLELNLSNLPEDMTLGAMRV